MVWLVVGAFLPVAGLSVWAILWVAKLQARVDHQDSQQAPTVNTGDILGTVRLAMASITAISAILMFFVAGLSFWGIGKINEITEKTRGFTKDLEGLRTQAETVYSVLSEASLTQEVPLFLDDPGSSYGFTDLKPGQYTAESWGRLFLKDRTTVAIRLDANLSGKQPGQKATLRMGATDGRDTVYTTGFEAPSGTSRDVLTDLNITALKDSTCEYFWSVRGDSTNQLWVKIRRVSLIKYPLGRPE